MTSPRLLLIILALALTPLAAAAQKKGASARYAAYIEQWAPEAVEQQRSSGIPASITLAQALLESAAGASTLATEGNNHFGIKCGSGWKGDTMLRDDDAEDECFRVYASAAESFADHSRFLQRPRYASLFSLDGADYAGWARGLSACGYATDPNYADRLISIIETYSLSRYDSGETEFDETADYIIAHIRHTHPVRRSRKLHFVIAAPGDTYAAIAREFSLPLDRLLAYNDAAEDGQIRPWEEVYLQKKLETPPDGMKKAVIGADESMHSLSQRFGIKLSRLRQLNPDAKDTPGTTLRLK